MESTVVEKIRGGDGTCGTCYYRAGNFYCRNCINGKWHHHWRSGSVTNHYLPGCEGHFKKEKDMSSGHGKVICQGCGKVISQCRCPCGIVRYEICDNCKALGVVPKKFPVEKEKPETENGALATGANVIDEFYKKPPVDITGPMAEAVSPVQPIRVIRERNGVQVEVLDMPGAGGACHTYDIIAPLTPGQKSNGAKFNLFAHIAFQNGPIKENGVNGCQQEDLLAIVIDRLKAFQAGPFACRENAIALTKCEEALLWLDKRTADRQARGVEGENKV